MVSEPGTKLVPVPPGDPFTPQLHIVPAGSAWFRVHTALPGRAANTFNPGYGKPTRFAFFTDSMGEIVPVLYAAESEEAAVCESILHDVPVKGGNIQHASYRDTAMGKIHPTRDLKLAKFMGTGLRKLGVEHGQLTSTGRLDYPITAQWAQAAHRADFDGVIWMSHRCNTDEAIILFGDRVALSDLEIDSSYARYFGNPADQDWLVDICTPLNVEVLTS